MYLVRNDSAGLLRQSLYKGDRIVVSLEIPSPIVTAYSFELFSSVFDSFGTSLQVHLEFKLFEWRACSAQQIERLSITFTANVKSETFAVSPQLCVQDSGIICICNE